MEELSIPPSAQNAGEAREMLRAWIADGSLHCTLNIGTWGEREGIVWGILLSDAARHVADAVSRQTGANRDEVLATIREHFDMEMDAPTGHTTGDFIQ